MSTFSDAQPFELALKNLPITAPLGTAEALVDVSDTIDFAKKILLQHKVKTFLASDVVRVAEMILQRRAEIADELLRGSSDGKL
jgi:hypothetical protein